MPTYEYECDRCGHRFERFQNMTDPPRKRCEKCRGKVRRLLGTGAGLIFKGSGFYLTDYRSPGYVEASKKDKPPDAGSGAKPAGGDSAKKAKPGKKTGGDKPTAKSKG